MIYKPVVVNRWTFIHEANMAGDHSWISTFAIVMAVMSAMLDFTVLKVAGDIAVRDCPLECECTGSVVKCTKARVFPEDLPAEMTEFYISDSTVDYIPINVFLNIPQLDRIRLSSMTINTVRACSFGERENTTEIIFNDVHINIIEGNAFSNLVNISKLWFIDSTITEMKSFSFHGAIGVSSLKFVGTAIDIMHPHTIRNLDETEELIFENCRIGKFLRNGLSFIQALSQLSILNTTIALWQCGSLETLTATSVTVRYSQFKCDCNLAWVWLKYPNDPVLFDNSNRCLLNNARMLPSLTVSDVCSDEGSRDNGCPRMLLPSTPHTCVRKFDTPYIPVEKVDYPKYFSRKPPGNSAGQHTLQFTFIYVCLILLVY